MSFVAALATIGLVLLLGCMSPGPDFVAVTSQAFVDRRAALRVALGISLAITIWASLSVFGLAVLVSRFDILYSAIRWIGALYLIWLGIGLLHSGLQHAREPFGPGRAQTGPGRVAGIRRGLALGLTNPKAAVFFSSLFVTLLPIEAPLWVNLAVVGLAALTALGWFVFIALAFSSPRLQQAYRRLQRGIDTATGLLLVGIGLHLALVGG